MNWTKTEFETYVMIFAAHCNFIETKKEEELILSKIDEKIYNRMHTEVVIDKNHESLDKIQQYLQENNYSQNEKEQFINKIKQVFFADGSVDLNEKKLFEVLKKMIQ